jgi:predicted nucleic acid-binding Zn ribbon protein
MATEHPNQRMTKGQWQVYRERCRVDSRQQPSRESHGDALGDALPGLMRKLGLDSEHWIETLTQEWVAIVGNAVGAHTRPGRVDGKHLTVFVDSSVWLNELKRYGAKQMLQNLQSRLGASRIQQIRLQLDPEARGSR